MPRGVRPTCAARAAVAIHVDNGHVGEDFIIHGLRSNATNAPSWLTEILQHIAPGRWLTIGIGPLCVLERTHGSRLLLLVHDAKVPPISPVLWHLIKHPTPGSTSSVLPVNRYPLQVQLDGGSLFRLPGKGPAVRNLMKSDQ